MAVAKYLKRPGKVARRPPRINTKDYSQVLSNLHQGDGQDLALRKAGVTCDGFMKYRQDNPEYDKEVSAIYKARQDARRFR